VRVALLAVLLVACQKPTLLGGEHGIDHVGVVVKDLAEARRTFHDQLGFGAMEAGHVANGIDNINYYFEDSTYLETLTGGSYASRPEGAAFAALSVASAQKTAAFLEQRGIRMGAPIPGGIRTARETAHWETLFFASSPLQADPIFFIAYAQPARSQHLEKLQAAVKSGKVYKHPNGALGVKGAWLAVQDLDAAVKAFESVGLPARDAFSEPRLGGVGRAIEAGQGKILLIAPAAPDGAVARFLEARHGPGLMGLSIEVSSLGLAQQFVSRATSKPAAPASGALGQSVWVDPSIAHGAWLELFQR
jgi:hypothetical protein